MGRKTHVLHHLKIALLLASLACAIGGIQDYATLIAVLPTKKISHPLPACSDPEIIFKPIDATRGDVNPTLSTITVDTRGEYIVRCRNLEGDKLLKYIAYEFGAAGERPGGFEFLSDSFGRGSGFTSTDRRFNFWHRVPSNGKTVYLVSPPSDDNGVVNGRSNFFLEPIQYTLKGVLPHAGVFFSVMPVSRELQNSSTIRSLHGLSLNISDGRIEFTSIGRKMYGASISTQCKESDDEITIELSLNARNFSIRWGCREKYLVAKGAHRVNFRTFGTIGQAKSQLWLGWNEQSTNASFTVKSLLLPGHDPLRPPSTLPQPTAMPAVESDEVGGLGPLDLPLGVEQPISSDGFVDVTMPPFFADPSGSRDSTAALQRAIDFARWHYLAVWIPVGNYRISDTIVAKQTTRTMMTGDIPGELAHGFTRDFLLDGVSSRYVAHYIRGEVKSDDARATIFLPPFSIGFTNSSSPKACIDMRYINPLGQEEPNAQYNTNIIGVKIAVGVGNAGAVGLRLRAAQGSGAEDVEIIFEGGNEPNAGLAGIVGGCGSGGAHHSVKVVGGRYGLDLRMSQPASTITGVLLTNQSCSAIVYEGFETLTAVGINISEFHGIRAIVGGYRPLLPPSGNCLLPVMGGDYQKTNGIIAGRMSFIDTAISFAAPYKATSIAFTTNRSLFLKNVWISGASHMAQFIDGVAKNMQHDQDSMWTHIVMFARGENSSAYPHHPEWILQSPTYIDGARYETGKAIIDHIEYHMPTPPSPSLIQRHSWGPPERVPCFNSNVVRNVRKPPYNAVGDGIHDDTVAVQQALDDAADVISSRLPPASLEIVFLPRGIYAISSPLRVKNGVALIGVAKHLSRLVMLYDDHLNVPNRGTTTTIPMLETDSDASFVLLAFFSITVWNTSPRNYAIRWQAKNGIVRGIHFNRANRCGSYNGPSCKAPVSIDHPMMLVTGNGTSLKYYTFFLEDCCRTETFNVSTFWKGYLAGPQEAHYRHLLVTDKAGPVHFYHLNCEHGTGEAICEFSNGAHDIDVFGFKAEGNTVALWIRDCNNINMYGSGGCGCVQNDTVWPAQFEQDFPTFYRIQRSSNVLLANVMDQGSQRRGDGSGNPFNEVGCDPNAENKILAQTKAGKKILTDVFDRPVAFVIN